MKGSLHVDVDGGDDGSGTETAIRDTVSPAHCAGSGDGDDDRAGVHPQAMGIHRGFGQCVLPHSSL